MKVLLAVLILVLIALQYRLWFGDGRRGRNEALEAEVADLKSGLDAIEERARSELGMIDSDEDFYQFVRERGARASVKTLELQAPEPEDGRLLIDRSGAPGGSGKRLPSAYPKQYLQLKDRCILQRTIDTLLAITDIKGVVVVLSKNDTLWSQLPASAHPQVLTTHGGSTRAESVVAGVTLVCEHDAARVLTAPSDITRLIERVMLATEHGGLLATKVQDTLKRGNTGTAGSTVPVKVKSTVSRDRLWNAQTPQMFRARLLRDALMAGYAPALVEALCPNFKITHSRDLDMARALIELSECCA